MRYLFLEDEGRESESAGRNEFREIAFEASLRRGEEPLKELDTTLGTHMMPLRQGESRCIERGRNRDVTRSHRTGRHKRLRACGESIPDEVK
jgi:hypothetical protein